MSYIGNAPLIGAYSKIDSIAGSFNGVTTVFSILCGGVATSAGQSANCIISVNGVLQEPYVAYTVSGSSITFTEAPASGATFFGIILGNTYDMGVPSDGSISTAKLIDASVSNSKIADGAVTLPKIYGLNSKMYFFGS